MLNDFRYAFRSLGKTPGLVLIVVLCLGLGVGANTTIFSFTNALFLRPLPVHEPDRLVRLYTGLGSGQSHASYTYPEFQATRSRSKAFAGVAAYRSVRVSVGQGEDVALDRAGLVSGRYFEVVGVTPVAGRFITEADDQPAGDNAVAVLSHAFWRARLAGDPAAIGHTIQVSGRPYTVIGVAPAEFFGVEPDDATALWVPLMSYRHLLGDNDGFLTQNWRSLSVVARLRPDVSMAQAQAEADQAASAVAREYGGEWSTLRFRVIPGGTLVHGAASSSAEIRTVFVLLNSVVALVLLIACANVANILLARTMARQREIVIRLSLGSGRVRLIRQLLAESILLGLGGGVVGLLLALWGSDLLRTFDLPPAINPAPDTRVLLYTLVVALLTGLIFGLAPALQATRVSLADALKQSTRTISPARSWLRATLVTGQLSLSVVLLVLSGLFLRAILELRTADSGIREERLLAATFDLRTLNLTTEQGCLLRPRSVCSTTDNLIHSS